MKTRINAGKSGFGWQIVGALILLLGSGLAADAQAQRPDGSVLQAYIERTGELLEWAGDLVRETESSQARQVLAQAADLHRRSQGLAVSDRLIDSYNLAKRARDAVWHSVRLARESMGLEERIRLRAERFADQLQMLLERAHDANDKRALDFLQRAGRHAHRAREQYQQGDFQLAWKLLQQAEELMRRGARFLADGAGPERLTGELERIRLLLDETRERLGVDAEPAAVELLREAQGLLEQALGSADRGEPGRAMHQAGLARRLALRAQGLGGDGPRRDEVEMLVERFDALAAQVSEQVADSGSEPARRRLENARQHRDRAGQALAAGRREAALRQIRTAHDLLAQVADLVR